MASEKSPYLAAGMRGQQVTQDRRKREKVEFVGARIKNAVRAMHDFAYSTLQHVPGSLESVCRRCGKPKFTVDGKRCSGKKA